MAAALSAERPVVRAVTTGFYLGDEQLSLPQSYVGFIEAMRLGLERGAKHAAVELTSEALAHGFIKAWPCQVGVFTNLTRDHLNWHGSAEHYLASKAQLFMHLPGGGAAVLNGRDEASELLAEVTPQGVRRILYGVPGRGEPIGPVDLEATSVETSWEGTRVALACGDGMGKVPAALQLRAIGEVQAENALAALAAAIACGVEPSTAARALAAASPPPGRFEIVADRPHVVVDYAHTPDALERTLRTARDLCEGRLTVVFGAGGQRDREKRPLLGQAARQADRIVLTSDNPRDEDPVEIARAIREGIGVHGCVDEILDRRDAIAAALADAADADVIVIAGKGHETSQLAGGVERSFCDADVVRTRLNGALGP